MRHSRTGFSNTRQHKTKQIHCPETTGLLTLTARAVKAEAELARSKAALDVMGKVNALSETLSESADTDQRSAR